MWFHPKWAVRAVRRDPLLSCAAVICLALGIGANTAVFTVASGLLARKIPAVHEPERLVAIHRTLRGSCCSENSYPVFQDVHRQISIFEKAAAHYPLLSVSFEGVRLWGQLVSPEYFDTVGTRLLIGRSFREEDSGAVVISHALWQKRFASSASIVGTPMTLQGASFTIIGVAPPSFRGPDLGIGADLWVPISSIDQVMPEHPSLADRSSPWLLVYARLKQGVTAAQAQARLNVLARQLAQDHPEADRDRGFIAEPAGAFHPSYRSSVVNVTFVAAALVCLVLIMACVNVANMLLARANADRKQIAIRAALGSGPGRIAAELILHSTILAVLGGVVGVGLSHAVLRIATSIHLPLSFPIEVRFEPDWRVGVFAVAISLSAGLLVGLLTALRASRPNLVAALSNAPWSGQRSRWELRDALVTFQVAVTAVLLIVTSLFLRSLSSASTVDPGFRTGELLLLDIDPRVAGSAASVSERVRSAVEAVPGVRAATFTDVVPLGMGARAANLRTAALAAPLRADVFQIGPRYFETLGIPLVRGGAFVPAAEPVAILNTTAADRLWPGVDPIGRTVQRGSKSYRIVGVVAGVKTRSVGEPERPCLYLPLLGPSTTDPLPFGLTVLVHSSGDPALLATIVRETVARVEPVLAISNVRTMTEHIDAALVFPRAGALVAGAFGMVAVLLTAVGLYSVISHSVARRTREFGIRVAVGAAYTDVLRAAASRGLIATAAGIVLGVLAAAAGTRTLRFLLFGIAPTDWISFTAAPLLVLLVSLLACYLPARRIARIDPLVALKSS